MPRRGNHAESGLSIVELLTVLGILALLLSLAISSQQTALAFVRRFQCQENLRQWGLATHFYVQDNNDYLPKDGSPNGSSIAAGWYVDLPEALGIAPYHEARWRTNSKIPVTPKLWLCPSNRRRSNGRNLFHYCLNQHINGVGTGKQIQISNLSTPGKLVWLFTTEDLLPSPNKIMPTPTSTKVEPTFCSWTVTHPTVQATNTGTSKRTEDPPIPPRSIGIQPRKASPSPQGLRTSFFYRTNTH